jgi:hypothetical protein
MECVPTTHTEVIKSSAPKLDTIPEANESEIKVFPTSQSIKNLDNLIHNLETIGNVKEHDKLNVDSNNNFSIDTLYYTQGIIRRIYGNGRDTTLNGLSKLIDDVFIFADDLLAKERKKRQYNMLNISYDIKTNVFDNKINNYKDISSDILNKIAIYLEKAIYGLQNIKITYINDSQVTDQLDIIISKITHRVDTIKKIVKNQKPF